MLQNPMVMQQMKVMMQDPSVKQRMQKMLSKLGADSGIDPALADPLSAAPALEPHRSSASASSCIALRHTPRNLATACAVRRSERLPARRRTRRCSRS